MLSLFSMLLTPLHGRKPSGSDLVKFCGYALLLSSVKIYETSKLKKKRHFFKEPLCKKCPYSELYWSLFSCIRTGISPYSVQIRENTNQNNSEYEHFLRSKQNYLNFILTQGLGSVQHD